MNFYWITQLGDADFCPPVKDISVAHFLSIHCSCSHASRLVIHIVGYNRHVNTCVTCSTCTKKKSKH